MPPPPPPLVLGQRALGRHPQPIHDVEGVRPDRGGLPLQELGHLRRRPAPAVVGAGRVRTRQVQPRVPRGAALSGPSPGAGRALAGGCLHQRHRQPRERHPLRRLHRRAPGPGVRAPASAGPRPWGRAGPSAAEISRARRGTPYGGVRAGARRPLGPPRLRPAVPRSAPRTARPPVRRPGGGGPPLAPAQGAADDQPNER